MNTIVGLIYLGLGLILGGFVVSWVFGFKKDTDDRFIERGELRFYMAWVMFIGLVIGTLASFAYVLSPLLKIQGT